MTKNELKNEYFDWMYRLVCNEKYYRRLSYRKLLKYLDSVEFIYTIGMDSNRAEDGIDLRYRFGYEQKHADPIITAYLDDRACSVLEMMVALAKRCEENIMDDPDLGDRTGIWFWIMVGNLGLRDMDDSCYNQSLVTTIILRFLNREYTRNGRGGLFFINNCTRDLRNTEIWNQMCWYLDSIID